MVLGQDLDTKIVLKAQKKMVIWVKVPTRGNVDLRKKMGEIRPF